MWEIYEHRRLARRLSRIPIEVLKRYEKWKDIVRISGPAGLRLVKGFHDEALNGEWQGFRSSRLDRRYHLTYEVPAEEIRVHVIDITVHDYVRRSADGTE